MAAADYEEIPYPVKEYATRLKEEHARNTSEFFEELVQRSGVDVTANAELARKIHQQEKQVALQNSRLGFRLFLRNLLILIALAGGIVVLLYLLPLFWNDAPDCGIEQKFAGIAGGAMAVSLILIFFVLRKKIRLLKEQVDEAQKLLNEMIQQASAQMQPLTELFQWDTIASLVMKTLPIVHIDRYFTRERLESLCSHFNWKSDLGANVSIAGCQSGTLNGNPWIIADTFSQDWGMETYYGSLTITWTERVTYTDSDGETHTTWETRVETLTASVDKPAPVYDRVKYLIYGNEAAPALTFSREPNPLSGKGNGFFERRGLKRAIAALEKKSRNMDTSFTIMDNREFDACFNAVDRNNELEFRLLFTPLAQQEMLALLRDKKQGYGDDFRFLKQNMINYVVPEHLQNIDISAPPDLFTHYDLKTLRQNFHSFSNGFFRAFYFSIAPLLCIPLYQQHRNFPDIYDGILDCGEPSDFEYESLANSMDNHEFSPASAITPCILKTQVLNRDEPATQLEVTAHAFYGEERVDYVPVLGGDGHWHNVPVHWTEYLPVSRTTPMAVCETGTSSLQDFAVRFRQDDWQTFFRNWNGTSSKPVLFRRGLIAFLQDR